MEWERERDILGRFPSDYLPPVTVLLAESRDPFHRNQSLSHSHWFGAPFSASSHQDFAIDTNSMDPSNGDYRQGYPSTAYNSASVPGSRGAGNRGNSISLNVHLAVPGQSQQPQPGTVTTTTTADGSHTPNTPEILNSIVNMQHGPFAGYSQPGGVTSTAAIATTGPSELATSSYTTLGSMQAQASQQIGEQGDTTGSVAPLASFQHPSSSSHAAREAQAAGLAGPSTLSVQHYRSQFIKEGLKMKVKQKLGAVRGRHVSEEESVASPCSSGTTSGLTSPIEPSTSFVASPASEDSCRFPADIKIKEELTEEDEIRRYKRRERNKVAATKCRNKKKLRTQLLIKESETLESQNIHLKTEIEKLESEKKRLMEVLSVHEPTCTKRLRPSCNGAQDGAQNDIVTEMDDEGNFNVRIPVPPRGTSFASSGDTSGTSSNEIMEWKVPSSETSFVAAGENRPFQHGNSGSCGDHYSMGGSFLAKRHPSLTYLDVESRCIAL